MLNSIYFGLIDSICQPLTSLPPRGIRGGAKGGQERAIVGLLLGCCWAVVKAMLLGSKSIDIAW